MTSRLETYEVLNSLWDIISEKTKDDATGSTAFDFNVKENLVGDSLSDDAIQDGGKQQQAQKIVVRNQLMYTASRHLVISLPVDNTEKSEKNGSDGLHFDWFRGIQYFKSGMGSCCEPMPHVQFRGPAGDPLGSPKIAAV